RASDRKATAPRSTTRGVTRCTECTAINGPRMRGQTTSPADAFDHGAHLRASSVTTRRIGKVEKCSESPHIVPPAAFRFRERRTARPGETALGGADGMMLAA